MKGEGRGVKGKEEVKGSERTGELEREGKSRGASGKERRKN